LYAWLTPRARRPRQEEAQAPAEEEAQAPAEEEAQAAQDADSGWDWDRLSPRLEFQRVLPATDEAAMAAALEIARFSLSCFLPQEDVGAALESVREEAARESPLRDLMHRRVMELWVDAAHGVKTRRVIRSLESVSVHFQRMTWRLAAVAQLDHRVKIQFYSCIVKGAVNVTLCAKDLDEILAGPI